MSLRLILGRSGTGKTTLCINEIIKKQNEALISNSHKNLIFIVPEQYSLQGEKSLVKSSNNGAIMDSQVLTFKRLAFHILSRINLKQNKTLEDIGKTLLLKKICIELQNEFKYFKLSSEKKGFINLLSEVISEFYKYEIKSEDIKTLYNSVSDNEILRNKLYDTSLIFDLYNEFISKNLISQEETLDVLSNNIKDSEFIKNSEIWIDGFNDFTEQEYKVISELMKYSKNINITLTTEPKMFYSEKESEVNPFYESFLTLQKIKNISESSKAKIIKPTELYKTVRYKNKSLEFLEKNFFVYNEKYKLTDDSIKIFEAKNKYSEVENTAKEIINSVRKYGYNFKDIAVMVKNVSDYKNIITDIFKEYEIPIFVDSKKDVSSYALSSYIKNLLDIVSFNYSYESVFGFLKSGLCDFTREETDILENYVLENGIKSYKWKYEFMKNGDKNEKEKINEIRVKFLSFVEPFTDKFSNTDKYKVKDICYSLYEFLKENKINEKINILINNCFDKKDFEKAKIHKQCFELIISILSKTNEILENEEMTISDFAEILEASFEESEIYLIPTGIDRVIIGDMERSRLPDIKYLFILGVNEGVIPSSNQDEGIFLNDEREIIESKGIHLSYNCKRKSFYENFLIYQAFTKPSERLFLSYSIGDFSGNAMKPSYILEKILKTFINLSVFKEKEFDSQILMKKPSFHKLCSNFVNIIENDNSFWKDIYSCYADDSEYNDKLLFLQNSIWEDETKFILTDKTLKKLFGKNINSSISKLEKYSNCPFSYYMRYILEAKEKKIFSVEPLDMGILFHEVLEDFSNTLLSNNLEWGEIENEKAENIINETFDKNIPEIGGGILLSTSSNKAIIEKTKTTIKKVVDILGYQIKSGGFKPKFFELGFGSDAEIPPIEIPLEDNRKLILSGKIDRVDILKENNKTYIKIIDYKSGSKEFSLTDIFYGLQLQLMIYINALTEEKGVFGDNIIASGAYYFRIKNPVIKSKTHFSKEEIETAVKDNFKMSGIILDDNIVIKNTDTNLFDENGEIKASSSSNIVPVATTKSKTFTSSSMCLSESLLSLIMEYSNKKAELLGNDIIKGNFIKNPIKKGNVTSCDYCEYKSVCRFNMETSNRNFNKIKKINKDDIYNLMKTKNN